MDKEVPSQYTFYGDPHATFAAFFGGSNPLKFSLEDGWVVVEILMKWKQMEILLAPLWIQHEWISKRQEFCGAIPFLKQDPPVIHELRVTEEIYSGCTKRSKISLKRLNSDGSGYRTEDKILTIEIKKGWKEGTKITFPREGDETPTSIPADIVFVIKDKDHPKFKRDGSNIIYTAKISLLRGKLVGYRILKPNRIMHVIFENLPK